VALVVPGTLDTRTGGYIYDRRLMEGLRRRGWSVDVLELDDTFPWPSASALEHASRTFEQIAGGRIVLIDSLALGAMPEIVERHAARLQLVGLVHLPLAAAHGLDADRAARLQATEARALRAVALVVVTGEAARPLLARYHLPPGRIVVIEPGTDRPRNGGAINEDSDSLPAWGPTESRHTRVELLTVAALHRGKGHEALLEALATVPHQQWHLVCAGSLTRDPGTVERVRAAATRLGMADRVSLVGDLDAPGLEACYNRADVFVLATLQETYGMAVAEALAHGLPVVATSVGAIPALVGDQAGIVVRPGDLPALSAALSRLIGDASLRARLAQGARRAAERLPDWDTVSAKMESALEALTGRG
jgi:glycosyltransferase involved in cell wall biosynthesis